MPDVVIARHCTYGGEDSWEVVGMRDGSVRVWTFGGPEEMRLTLISGGYEPSSDRVWVDGKAVGLDEGGEGMKGDELGVVIGGPDGDRRWWFSDEFSWDSRPFVSTEELDLRLLAEGYERVSDWTVSGGQYGGYDGSVWLNLKGYIVRRIRS